MIQILLKLLKDSGATLCKLLTDVRTTVTLILISLMIVLRLIYSYPPEPSLEVDDLVSPTIVAIATCGLVFVSRYLRIQGSRLAAIIEFAAAINVVIVCILLFSVLLSGRIFSDVLFQFFFLTSLLLLATLTFLVPMAGAGWLKSRRNS